MFTHRNRFVDGLIVERQLIALDFDNTLTTAVRGEWPNVHLYPGAERLVVTLNRMGYLLYILTGRPEGPPQDRVRDFVAESELLTRTITKVTNVKDPDTVLIIDDRAFRFNGDWEQAIPEIQAVLAWHEGCADELLVEQQAEQIESEKEDGQANHLSQEEKDAGVDGK